VTDHCARCGAFLFFHENADGICQDCVTRPQPAMTPDQLTAPERDLIQWLSDTIGLSKNHEAELARRLVAMRAAPLRVQQPAPAPSEGEIEHAMMKLANKARVEGMHAMWEMKRGDEPSTPGEAERVVKETHEAAAALRALMRRAAAQAPSSGNDKLRRLREQIVAIVNREPALTKNGLADCWYRWFIEQIDALLAEPSEPAAADGELLAAAEWALRVIRDGHCSAKVPSPERLDEPCTVSEALERSIAKARPSGEAKP